MGSTRYWQHIHHPQDRSGRLNSDMNRSVLKFLLRVRAIVFLSAFLCVGMIADASAHDGRATSKVNEDAKLVEIVSSKISAGFSLADTASQTNCGVGCCSMAGCSVVFDNAIQPVIFMDIFLAQYSLPGNTQGKTSPPSALKRPPRS